MRTIREVKNICRDSCNVNYESVFNKEFAEFWDKLNKLGADGVDWDSITPDIDAEKVISEEEYNKLLNEFDEVML